MQGVSNYRALWQDVAYLPYPPSQGSTAGHYHLQEEDEQVQGVEAKYCPMRCRRTSSPEAFGNQPICPRRKGGRTAMVLKVLHLSRQFGLQLIGSSTFVESKIAPHLRASNRTVTVGDSRRQDINSELM
eukprot:s3407_g9.t1